MGTKAKKAIRARRREERAFSPGRAKPAEIGGQEGTVVPFAGSDAAGNREAVPAEDSGLSHLSDAALLAEVVEALDDADRAEVYRADLMAEVLRRWKGGAA